MLAGWAAIRSRVLAGRAPELAHAIDDRGLPGFRGFTI
jgi:hypothetical protein